ncbi:MAG TPA: hypothetical protein VGT02_07200 [Methylomirabilota bacterium]|nr:hypothetical protein [Methylomirabilota bacterium]
MSRRVLALRLALVLAGAVPLVYGLAALLDARMLMNLTGLLSGAQYTLTPALDYARKPLGIYVAMFGALLLYTIADPARYRAVITWGAVLLIARGIQRLLIAGELHELFAIPFARNLVHVVYLCALGTALLLLRPPAAAPQAPGQWNRRRTASTVRP